MTRTTRLLLAGALGLTMGTGSPAIAQEKDSHPGMDEIKADRASVEDERRKIVAAGLNLTAEEHQKFWPMYQEYRAAMGKVTDKGMKIIFSYADAYKAGSLEDAKAKTLLEEYASYDETRVRTRETFMKKFMDVLPASKVFRYFQIENKLDAIVTMDLAQQVPLAK